MALPLPSLPTDHSRSNGSSTSRQGKPTESLIIRGRRSAPPCSERPRPAGDPTPIQSRPASLHLASDGSSGSKGASAWNKDTLPHTPFKDRIVSLRALQPWRTIPGTRRPPFEIHESFLLLYNLPSCSALPYPFVPDESFWERQSIYLYTGKIHCIS